MNDDRIALAVVCSDIHLSHQPPIFRSDEPDWYQAMARSLDQVGTLSRHMELPVIIAGDIFDKWHANKTPELINFAIEQMSKWGKVYAIPGQHDLPGHRIDQKGRSAYGTLVAAGVVEDLVCPVQLDNVRLHPFPWGEPLHQIEAHVDKVNVAIVHRFVWAPGHKYPGVTADESSVSQIRQLAGFDAAVFGDNHSAFQRDKVFNCGTLMIRKSSETGYEPTVGILYDDASIEKVCLDMSQDVYLDLIEAQQLEDEQDGVTEFVQYLKGSIEDESSLDFRNSVVRFMDLREVKNSVKELVLSSMD